MQHCILSAGLLGSTRSLRLLLLGVATLLLFGGILKESQPTKSAFEVLPVGFGRCHGSRCAVPMKARALCAWCNQLSTLVRAGVVQAVCSAQEYLWVMMMMKNLTNDGETAALRASRKATTTERIGDEGKENRTTVELEKRLVP
jgi:hypothetical protein